MSGIRCLPAISTRAARVLILGSIPGVESLARGEYYAHPQNLFWPFMEELFGIPRSLAYAQRARRLSASGIALWDVIESCERNGSLDSSIRELAPNDFAAFFKAHPRIRAIFLNGKKAEAVFRRYVMPRLGEPGALKNYIVLPSTSPANASFSRAEKLATWTQIRDYLQP